MLSGRRSPSAALPMRSHESATRLYTSENVIAYRVKRMGRITGTNGREALTSLLAPYLRS